MADADDERREGATRAASEARGRSENLWLDQEHEVVFRRLRDTLPRVRFPASKRDLTQLLGGERVTAESRLPLVKYLQALPNRRYESADDVRATLDARWRDVKGLRDAGYQPDVERGLR